MSQRKLLTAFVTLLCNNEGLNLGTQEEPSKLYYDFLECLTECVASRLNKLVEATDNCFYINLDVVPFESVDEIVNHILGPVRCVDTHEFEAVALSDVLEAITDGNYELREALTNMISESDICFGPESQYTLVKPSMIESILESQIGTDALSEELMSRFSEELMSRFNALELGECPVCVEL